MPHGRDSPLLSAQRFRSHELPLLNRMSLFSALSQCAFLSFPPTLAVRFIRPLTVGLFPTPRPEHMFLPAPGGAPVSGGADTGVVGVVDPHVWMLVLKLVVWW
jgi:hypothetical protein